MATRHWPISAAAGWWVVQNRRVFISMGASAPVAPLPVELAPRNMPILTPSRKTKASSPIDMKLRNADNVGGISEWAKFGLNPSSIGFARHQIK
jgi:hypothetical protein